MVGASCSFVVLQVDPARAAPSRTTSSVWILCCASFLVGLLSRWKSQKTRRIFFLVIFGGVAFSNFKFWWAGWVFRVFKGTVIGTLVPQVYGNEGTEEPWEEQKDPWRGVWLRVVSSCTSSNPPGAEPSNTLLGVMLRKNKIQQDEILFWRERELKTKKGRVCNFGPQDFNVSLLIYGRGS